MSRSSYTDDYCDDNWAHIRYRGAVSAAFRGKRGQAFLKEMLAALDALPEKKLIAGVLEYGGEVCAIGTVGKARGINMDGIDPEDSETVAKKFGIAESMAREIVYYNDDFYSWLAKEEDPAARFARMRAWVVENIHKEEPNAVAT